MNSLIERWFLAYALAVALLLLLLCACELPRESGNYTHAKPYFFTSPGMWEEP